MQLTSLLGAFLVLFSSEHIKAAVKEEFLHTGEDLVLYVPEDVVPDKFTIILLEFNSSTPLAKFLSDHCKVEDAYIDRAQCSWENKTVTLKKLRTSDSGVYVVLLSGDEDKTLTSRNITVLDPVELRTVSRFNASSSSFNCTVTCSTGNSNISSTFRCDNKTCLQEEGERSEVTQSGASPRLYQSNASIICSHGNQVSETQSKTMIESCSRPEDQSVNVNAAVPLRALIVAVLVGALIIIVLGGALTAAAAAVFMLWLYLKKRNSSCSSQDQKVTYSSNGTSPSVQISMPPPQDNGASRDISKDELDPLMEENAAVSPTEAEKTADIV